MLQPPRNSLWRGHRPEMRGWFPLATSGVRGAVEISCLGAFLVAFFFSFEGEGGAG